MTSRTTKTTGLIVTMVAGMSFATISVADGSNCAESMGDATKHVSDRL